MLSSLSSYIWGASPAEEDAQRPQDAAAAAARDASPVPEDDWVMVGKSAAAPGNLHLGSLVPGTPTLPGSLPSSSSASEVGDDGGDEEAAAAAAEPEPAAAARRHQQGPRPQQPASAVQQLSHGALSPASAKTVRSAQLSRQRNSGKALSSKALKRNNLAVMTQGGGKKSVASRHNFSIKMAGSNKNLKQC